MVVLTEQKRKQHKELQMWPILLLCLIPITLLILWTGIWHRPSSQQAEIWSQIVSKYTMLLKWSRWLYFRRCNSKSVVLLFQILPDLIYMVIWCMVLFGLIVHNPVHCKCPANVSFKWKYILNKQLNGIKWKYWKSTHPISWYSKKFVKTLHWTKSSEYFSCIFSIIHKELRNFSITNFIPYG